MPTRARPVRIQLRRSKGWRKPAGTVVVARPSKWGNPWPVDPAGGVPDRATAVARFRDFVAGEYDPAEYPSRAEIRAELAGRDLACWCPVGEPCHGDILLEIANAAPA